MSNQPPALGGGVLRAAIVDGPIDLSALLALAGDPGIGALSVFLGTVREVNEGRSVTGMAYEAYAGMALAELQRLAHEVCAEWPGVRLCVEHRVGVLTIGEVSVAIVAAHAHRAPAMEASRAVIERLKQRVPIWKLEHYVDGERAWVDPTRGPGGSGHA